jgi:acyl dehydratase
MITGKYFEGFVVAETTVSEDRTITDDDIRSYCVTAHIDHPIHEDPQACLEQFGCANLLAPGIMIVGIADAIFSRLVSPAVPYSPHYGYDKIRFIQPVFGGDVLHCEFKLAEKSARKDQYGMLTFETYVKREDGDPVIFIVDKLLVAYRNNPAVATEA